MITWINEHGGIAAVVLLVMTLANLVLSFVSKVLELLKVNAPSWVASVAGVVSKIVDWLSANVAHKAVDKKE